MHMLLFSDYYIVYWGREGKETKIRKINDCLKSVLGFTVRERILTILAYTTMIP